MEVDTSEILRISYAKSDTKKPYIFIIESLCGDMRSMAYKKFITRKARKKYLKEIMGLLEMMRGPHDQDPRQYLSKRIRCSN